MPPESPVTRRLLLRRFTAGTSVFGTFLLPPALHDAMAARPRAIPPSDPEPKGARPPPPLVMLDPGHGGKDPGAIGVSGTYEKQVALATALELKRQLEAGGRYRVELTRTPRRVHPAGRPGRPRPAQERRVVRLDARRCAVGPLGARRLGLYPGADRVGRADRRAGAHARTAPTASWAAQWQGTSPEVSQILASLVRQETRVRVGAHCAPPGRQPGPGSADAAEPRPPRRIRGAEGRRHPQRAGRDGVHVEPARRGRIAPAGASHGWWPRPCGGRSMRSSPAPAERHDRATGDRLEPLQHRDSDQPKSSESRCWRFRTKTFISPA